MAQLLNLITSLHTSTKRDFLGRMNDDKVACFELYRRNIRSPEILTFDELYYRAGCIVENISCEINKGV